MDLIIFLWILLWSNVFGQQTASLGAVLDGVMATKEYQPQLMLTPSTPSITHFVNDSFIIFCKTVQTDVSPKWKDPTGTSRENTKGRVHIERKAGLLALVFEHIDLTDRGNWTCETAEAIPFYKNNAVDSRKSFELLVNQKISFDKTEMVQSAREGRDATVYCFVGGEPRPDISWLHNDELINTEHSAKYKGLSDGLFIKNVSQADAGEYTCRAIRITPTFSDSDQITILLRIQHKPHWFSNETGSTLQYAYIGGSVNVTCEAMGEPPPSFTWIHEGRAIVGRNYRIFYADYGSTLQIHVLNDTHLGDYKCKVANPLGMLERIIRVRKGQKPAAPSRFQLNRIHSDAFELDIRSDHHSTGIDENMQTYGYRVEYMSESAFKYSAGNWSYAKRRDFSFHIGHRFIVSNLERNTTYLMRAASRNLAGLSEWSSVKIFATLSSASSQSLQGLLYLIIAGLSMVLNGALF